MVTCFSPLASRWPPLCEASLETSASRHTFEGDADAFLLAGNKAEYAPPQKGGGAPTVSYRVASFS